MPFWHKSWETLKPRGWNCGGSLASVSAPSAAPHGCSSACLQHGDLPHSSSELQGTCVKTQSQEDCWPFIASPGKPCRALLPPSVHQGSYKGLAGLKLGGGGSRLSLDFCWGRDKILEEHVVLELLLWPFWKMQPVIIYLHLKSLYL